MGDKDKSDLETVKLNSADGHQFIVHRKAAMISGTIKSMLSENGMIAVCSRDGCCDALVYLSVCSRCRVQLLVGTWNSATCVVLCKGGFPVSVQRL